MSIGDKLLKSAAGAGGLTPSENFTTVTYTGNSGTQAITGVGFKPDWVWIKERDDGAENHNLTDSTRGTNKILNSNNTVAEITSTSRITSFDTDGFTLGSNNETNDNGVKYVAWCWKAGGGTTSSDGEGSITSTVQANTNAGFSIVKYVGNVTAGATVGHGLGAVPKLIILKNMDRAGYGWLVYHGALGATRAAAMNNTDAFYTGTNYFNDTNPTSTVFSLGSDTFGNYSGDDYIAYCFAEISGFSKFGSYAGNGSENGPIVETGFEVGYLMIKRVDSGDNWYIVDNARSTSNPRQAALFANLDDAEYATYGAKADFLSNGFQIVSTDNSTNASGGNFVYMAFATDPDTQAPTLADSFSVETYTGTGGSRSVTGVGFKPDLIWMKRRNTAQEHALVDAVRGVQKHLNSDLNAAESTETNGVSSFDSDGFTVGANGLMNNTSDTYVAWAWKANDDVPTSYGGPATAIYKMEDNVNNVGGGFNASATAITYSSGKFNKAADFTGGNSQGGSQISVSNDVLGESNSIFSISLWVKCDNSAGEVPLFGNGGTVGGTSGVALYLLNGSLSLTFRTNPSQEFYESIISLNDNNWHHVVMTYGNGPFHLYVDNVLVKSGQSSYYLNNTTPSYDLFFGNRWNRNDNNAVLNGQLDQIRIYDGVINATDVDVLYNETASDNDDLFLGGPPETTISVNANAGFSIVKFTTPNTPGSETRIPHGLSSAPDMIILKRTDGVEDWYVYHTSMGLSEFMRLNTTAAKATATNMFNTVNATVFNPSWTLTGNQQAIAYCFHDVTGYSKFGSYTGTGATGNTVTVGFQPDFVMVKATGEAEPWFILDSARDTSNPRDNRLMPDSNAAEDDGSVHTMDFNSDNFTLNGTVGNGTNGSGKTYIYMAFKIN